jgi:hypothetical protein
MKFALRSGEQIIKEGGANLQKNIETVGGWLYLTNQRMLFIAHRFNIQGGATEIDIPSIHSARPSWTKFLGFLPTFPNSLSIHTKQGQEYRFVVFGRGTWAATISAIIQEANASQPIQADAALWHGLTPASGDFSTTTPRGSMKTFLKVLVGLAVLISVVIAVLAGIGFYATSGMTDTANEFFRAVKQQDMTKAHGYLAAEFKASTDEAALKTFLSQSAILNFKETSWSGRSLSDGRGDLRGSITTETGGYVPIRVVLVKEVASVVRTVSRHF